MALLEQLLSQRQVWQAGATPQVRQPGLSSGYPELDALLPDGGWPADALTEILCDHPGIGELRLLAPLLSRLSRQERWQLWIDPPWLPYAPALAQAGIDLSRILLIDAKSSRDGLWTFEQGLRSGACSIVLGWCGQLTSNQLRRLQLAAASSGTPGILFRPGDAAAQASPAALRLQLAPIGPQPGLAVLKRRGAWPLPIQPAPWLLSDPLSCRAS